MTPKNYDKDVFVNCPFDDEFSPMMDAIIFSIFDCGFRPRCTREMDDSGRVRIEKIITLINECKFGIHDISRTELDLVNSLPRFNMPLELRIFIGAMRFGNSKHKVKSTMIVDTEAYRYQKFISDIAGQDIRPHGNDPEKIIIIVRNWLKAGNPEIKIPGGVVIARRYREYCIKLPALCGQLSLEIDTLSFNDTTQMITTWLTTNPTGSAAA